jgi:hypothetical protein
VLEIYAHALHGDEASASAVMGDVFATVLRQPTVLSTTTLYVRVARSCP